MRAELRFEVTHEIPVAKMAASIIFFFGAICNFQIGVNGSTVYFEGQNCLL